MPSPGSPEQGLIQSLEAAEAVAKRSVAGSSVSGDGEGSESNVSEPRDSLAQKEAAERSSAAGSAQERKSRADSKVSSHEGTLHSSGGSSRGASSDMSLEGLTQKVLSLTQALNDRDDQQASLLKKMAKMESARENTAAEHRKEMKTAKKAQKDAENARDNLVDKMVGQEAKAVKKKEHDDESKVKAESVSEGHRLQSSERLEELQALEAKVLQMNKDTGDETAHQERKDTDHALQIDKLESMLAGLMKELRNQESATAQDDSAVERARLQQEVLDMHFAAQQQNREMSDMRLEMLGLKKTQAKQEASSAAKAASSKPLGLGRGQSRKGAPASSMMTLQSIDEEEDFDDIQSIGISASASDCVSSDAGGVEDAKMRLRDVDDSALAKSKAHNDELFKELYEQRMMSERSKEDQHMENAEQESRIARLLNQLADSKLANESLRDHVSHIKQENEEDALRSANALDALHLDLRVAKDCRDQQEVESRKQAVLNDQHLVEAELLETRAYHSEESFRIAQRRIVDMQQELANQEVRHRREVSLLQGRSSSKDSSSSLETQLQDLQEERNMLANQVEAQQIQHRMELDELQMQHGAELMEVKRDCEHRLQEWMVNNRDQQKFDDASVSGGTASTETMPRQRTAGSAKGPSSWQGESSEASDVKQDTAQRQPQKPKQVEDRTGCFQTVIDWALKVDTGLQVREDSPASSLCWQDVTWEVLNMVPKVLALSCNLLDYDIMKVSRSAYATLGSALHGQSLLRLFQTHRRQVIMRAINVHQTLAESNSAMQGFIWRDLGSFDICPMDSEEPIMRASVAIAHLPAEDRVGTTRDSLVLLISPSKASSSDASGLRMSSSSSVSEIMPSDSVSVKGDGPRRRSGQHASARAALRTKIP